MDLSFVEKNWISHARGDIQEEISAWDSVAEDYVPDGEAVGVDFSPKMIEAAKRSARERNIGNVAFYERDWFRAQADEFMGKYDLAFAHTTPAVSDYVTLVKLMDASRRYCVLCKPARRTDEVFGQVRRLVGYDESRNDDAVAYAFDTVWGHGYNPEVTYQETVWKSEKTLEEARRWYLGRLKGNAALDDRAEKKICTFLEEISKDGMVSETIRTTLVNIFWEKQSR